LIKKIQIKKNKIESNISTHSYCGQIDYQIDDQTVAHIAAHSSCHLLYYFDVENHLINFKTQYISYLIAIFLKENKRKYFTRNNFIDDKFQRSINIHYTNDDTGKMPFN